MIVVNDGSSDDTERILAPVQGIRAINLPRNHGKAYAVHTGAIAATGDILIFLDADLQGLLPTNISMLLQPILRCSEGMSLGMKQNSWWLFRKLGIDFLIGERALSKKHFLAIHTLLQQRYGMEVILNDYFLRHHLPIFVVPMHNVSHPLKQDKLGFWQAQKAEMGMNFDIIRAIGPLHFFSQLFQMARLAHTVEGVQSCAT